MSRGNLYTAEQIETIARLYDGTTGTLDSLLSRFGGQRHNIINAARRGGYVTQRQRKSWSDEDDAFLKENWGRMPVADLALCLGATELACNLRRKRLGISSRDFVEYSVTDLERLLKVDHRIWQRFLDDGWLKAWEQPRRNATPVKRISVDNLHAFFRSHPEVIDYRGASTYVRGVLELDKLPTPPAFKRLTCRSESYDQTERLGIVGRRVHHGEKTLVPLRHDYTLASCGALGGIDFWAPTYEASPACPRCGCKVSRFSEKALFTDETPDDEHLALVADKLGLRFENGQFVTGQGTPLFEEDLLRYVFSTKRRPSKALSVFRRLLTSGLTVAPERPVPPERLLPPLLAYSLRPRQQEAFDEFLATGAVGIYWPPGAGKMYFLGEAYTRLSGTHALFVHSNTIREAWVSHLRRHAPRITVKKVWEPAVHHRIEVFKEDGAMRCAIEVWNYKSRFDFSSRRYVLAGYDEAHFLPGKNSHRLSMIHTEFRVGLTATPFREDGHADLIQVMSGRSIGLDWTEMREGGEIKEVPVLVKVVRDLEHKYDVLAGRLAKCRGQTLVFSDSLEDGARIARENHIPFLCAESADRLETIGRHRVVAMSRVGDCGMDIPGLREVIEFNFHHGSRAQSLQRYGRLLHAEKPVRHTVLMTVKEFSLYHKRLTALESKGFRISIQMCSEAARTRAKPLAKCGAPGESLLSSLVAQLAA